MARFFLGFLVTALLFGGAARAQSIPNLPIAGSVSNTDPLAVWHAGGTKQATAAQIVSGGLGTAPGAFGLNILASTTQSGAQSLLGLGSAAYQPATAFDVSGAAAGAQAASLQKSNNLSDLASAAAARINLGLGSAATQPATAFDAAGAASTAQVAAETFASNSGNQAIGTLPSGRLSGSYLGITNLGTISMGGPLTLFADAAQPLQPVSLEQLNSLVVNKYTASAVATSNVSLTSAPATIDGYTLTAGQCVLLTNQTSSVNNGLWVYPGSGSAFTTRCSGATVYSGLYGSAVLILNGTAFTGTTWSSTSPASGTIGTTPITFVQTGLPGGVTAGVGITVSGNSVALSNTGVTAGTYGSATQAAAPTVNAQGQITGIATYTVTPAIGSITGLATGVAAALAVAPNTNGGFAGSYMPTFSGTATFAGLISSSSVTPFQITGTGSAGTVTIQGYGGDTVETITRNGTNNYNLAWNGTGFYTGSITSSADILAIGGNITSTNPTGAANVYASGASGYTSGFGLCTYGAQCRWNMGLDTSGNYNIYAFNSSGAYLGDWLSINNATGAVTIQGDAAVGNLADLTAGFGAGGLTAAFLRGGQQILIDTLSPSIVNSCVSATSSCSYNGSYSTTGPLIEYCSASNCPFDSNGTHMYAQDVQFLTTNRPSSGATGAQEVALAIGMYSVTGADGPTSGNINNGKTALSISHEAMPGSGATWAMTSEMEMKRSSSSPYGAINAEFDLNNSQANCGIGVGCNSFNVWIAGASAYTNSVGLYVHGISTTGGYESHIGVLIDGAQTAQDSGLQENTSASVGITESGAHNTAINEISTSTNGIIIGGTKSSSLLLINGTSSSGYSINDSSTSTRSLYIHGTHTYGIDLSQDSSSLGITMHTGQSLCFSGTSDCAQDVSGVLQFNQALSVTGLSSGAGNDPLCWTTSSGLVTYGTSSCTVSDARKKHDWTPGNVPGIEAVMKMTPGSYVLNDDPHHIGQQVGMLAQDVAKIDPRLVTYYYDGPDKGTPSGIRYEQLAGSVLVKGEQDLQHEIDILKAEVLVLQLALGGRASLTLN
jgi:hypothetical protein